MELFPPPPEEGRVGASYTFITMRLRNTETNAVQPLERRPEPVRLYVCGITPYDTTHLGHAFTYVVFDVLVRALRASGQPVRYVQNVTDVDDDIIKRARELGTTWDHLAVKETALYADDMADLNVLAAPTVQHVLRLQQPPAWVLRRGKVLARNELARELFLE